MKVSELKKLIASLPDDFEVSICLSTEIPKEELGKMVYPYNVTNTTLGYAGYDIGYSDRVITLFVEQSGKDG